jgi:predicted nuclease of predicted toxin-antitoxin system
VRLKLDENLGLRTARTFAEAGHDVATVAGQGLAGFADVDVLAVCVAEQRALVTLDLDFANPFRFDPSPTAGIAVLRSPTSRDAVISLPRPPCSSRPWSRRR